MSVRHFRSRGIAIATSIMIIAATFAGPTASYAEPNGTPAKTAMDKLKDKGYTCVRGGVNDWLCTKKGEKDQTCDRSGQNCSELPREGTTGVTSVLGDRTTTGGVAPTPVIGPGASVGAPNGPPISKA
jgi:hypothetical protein